METQCLGYSLLNEKLKSLHIQGFWISEVELTLVVQDEAAADDSESDLVSSEMSLKCQQMLEWIVFLFAAILDRSR